MAATDLAIEDRPIAQDYFHWLCSQVMLSQQPGSPRSYTFLADRMNRMVFNDNVPNDRNRSADGIQLRHDFLAQHGADYGSMEVADLLYPQASVFEVLVGLAHRANFEVEVGIVEWFGRFIQNLRLTSFTDSEIQPGDIQRIGRVLAKFNERRYLPNGRGGLFPLKGGHWPDQREEELWYQLSHYIEENNNS